MTTTPFNDGWTVRAGDGPEKPVNLPHDAMIGEPRSGEHPTGSHGAYFPGGRYRYTKLWTAPVDADRRRQTLIFEGVYGDTVVRLNGTEIGSCISGYREFTVRLDTGVRPGAENLIEVDVDNSRVPNSRWYSGSGIYRPVWMEDTAPIAFAHDGVRLHTRTIDDSGNAEIDVHAEIDSPQGRPLLVTVTLTDGTRVVASGENTVAEAVTTLRLTIPDATPWSDETPHLYQATVLLQEPDGTLLDQRTQRIGLRTVEVDAAHGLRINGRTVLLRGACVHHDNGILGAVTFRAAEFRRARILKENGFNAVRSAHNPLSRAFLDACDEIGLYVMDELTDVWYGSKTRYDLASRFEDVWRDDARAMVAKDRNHPSVIMYSIGNEIAETSTARGAEVARQLDAFVKDLDPHRPTTLAVNFLLNVMASRGANPFDRDEHTDPGQSPMSSTMANIVANRIGFLLQTVARLPAADRVSRDAFAAVDVAGYNYGWGRYAADARRHPTRVVVGSESMTGDIAKIWPLVERLPNLIGDFMWTGWDYLGETGAGSWTYGDTAEGMTKSYPHIVGGAGAIDITGVPGAPALLARAVWGQLPGPQIAVRPLDQAGKKVRRVAWRSSDAVQSWAWAGCEGRTAHLEIYSADDEVEVLVNGRSLGRRQAGRRRGFLARYRTRYEPGEVVAIGYRRGRETGRTSLRSASEPRLRLRAESDRLIGDGQDLLYAWIELADDTGVVEMTADDIVTVSVTGAGTLAALGSAAPSTVMSYVTDVHATAHGRALAIVRAAHETGDVTIDVTSTRHGAATLTLPVTCPGTSMPSPIPATKNGVASE